MTDLRTQLRDALREEEDERLPVDDLATMRRVVLASVRTDQESHRAHAWLQPLAVAATVVAMIAAGIAAGQRFEADQSLGTAPGVRESLPANAAPERARQLHFSTPGGTRIIWIFNSDLDLKTTP
jgi:hypothetical protein